MQALKQSARKTHHQLYKIIRKFHDALYGSQLQRSFLRCSLSLWTPVFPPVHQAPLLHHRHTLGTWRKPFCSYIPQSAVDLTAQYRLALHCQTMLNSSIGQHLHCALKELAEAIRVTRSALSLSSRTSEDCMVDDLERSRSDIRETLFIKEYTAVVKSLLLRGYMTRSAKKEEIFMLSEANTITGCGPGCWQNCYRGEFIREG
ncbi:hypothetical protein EDC04DRAFT_2598515 [Pisolithus marmoratus]|nr:hypothetical protein EDC04DRAFT_2598515 [Pisolithus marmoratus]